MAAGMVAAEGQSLTQLHNDTVQMVVHPVAVGGPVPLESPLHRIPTGVQVEMAQSESGVGNE